MWLVAWKRCTVLKYLDYGRVNVRFYDEVSLWHQ